MTRERRVPAGSDRVCLAEACYRREHPDRLCARRVACLSSLALQPGMPAEVMIVTGARTPIDYLLTPIVESLGRALREE